MVLINILLVSFSLFATQTKLLEVLSQENVRYSSNVTNISIYKKGSSTLSYSTRKSAGEIIRHEGFASYEVQKHPSKDLFLISTKEDDFTNINAINEVQIYLFNLEDKSLLLLGSGSNAKFNYNGEYLSYYSHSQKKIYFHKLIDINSPKEIALNNKNSLFTPEIEIVNDQLIYFTDINSDNEIGVLKLSPQDNKRKTLFKNSMLNLNMELLATSEKIYILDSTLQKKGHCFIYSLDHANDDISKREMLFDSQSGGCHQIGVNKKDIVFIKNIDLSNDISEVLLFDVINKKPYIISDLKYVQNYYQIDDSIFIFFRDTRYTTSTDNEFIIKKEYKEIGNK